MGHAKPGPGNGAAVHPLLRTFRFDRTQSACARSARLHATDAILDCMRLMALWARHVCRAPPGGSCHDHRRTTQPDAWYLRAGAGRWPGQSLATADRLPGQAGAAFCRLHAHHRFCAGQLRQLGFATHQRVDAIPLDTASAAQRQSNTKSALKVEWQLAAPWDGWVSKVVLLENRW